MKKLTKLLAVIITIIMIIGIITPINSLAATKSFNSAKAEANENADIKTPNLTTAKELLQKIEDDEKPQDYVENGACPSGIEKDKDTQAVSCDELITLQKNDDDSHKTKANIYQSINDKSTKSSTQMFSNLDFIASDSISFGEIRDGVTNGKKDHLAIIGYHVEKQDKTEYGELQLAVTDLSKTDDNGEFVIDDKITLVEKNTAFPALEDFNTFCSVERACLDGKSDNTIAVSYIIPSSDASLRKRYIEFFQLIDGKITSVKKINVSEYMQNNIDVDHYNPGRPCQTLGHYPYKFTFGDFDRDGIDEMAITTSLFFTKDVRQIKEGANYGTTEVVILDDIQKESPVKVYDDFVINKLSEDSTYEYYDMMEYSDCASGDIDGNKADELIIAGCVTGVSLRKEYQFENKVFPYNYDPKDGQKDDKPGIATVFYDGEKNEYVMSNMERLDFGEGLNLLNRKFYHNFHPIETAYMAGHDQPCSLFFNGAIFNYRASKWTLDYSYEELTNTAVNDRFETLYFMGTKAGNITNDALGKESFVFNLLGTRYVGDEDIINEYYACTISLDDPQAGIYVDNSKDMKNEKGEFTPDESYYIDSGDWKLRPGFSVMVADIDTNDGLKIQYAGTDYLYADPQVEAVIQAAPYFKELGGWSTFMGNTEFSMITGNATKNGAADNWSTEGGFIVAAGAESPVATVEAQLSLGYSHTNSSGWSETYSKSFTKAFSACDHDTVVIYRTPITLYGYKIWDNEKNDWMKNEDGTTYYSVTATRLAPVYEQMTFDQYNEFVEEYNKQLEEASKLNGDGQKLVYLKQIKNSTTQTGDFVDVLPLNSTGNPASYKGTPHQPYTYLSDSFALDTGGGSAKTSYEEVHTSTDSNTFSNGLHINFTTICKAKIPFGVCSATIGGGMYLDFAYSWEHTHETEVSSGVGFEGQVVNIDPKLYVPGSTEMLKNYKFTWQFSSWNTILQDDLAKEEKDEIQVPVLEYVVNNVQYGGQYPSNIHAAGDASGKNILLTWNPPIDQHGSPSIDKNTTYHIYRGLADEDISKTVEIGTIPSDPTAESKTYSYTEPIAVLERNKTYNYYVGVEYSGLDKPYQAISVYPQIITRGSGQDYTIGDSNKNGRIDISDATLVQLYLAALVEIDQIDLQAADANEDGTLNISDASRIQMFLAKEKITTNIGTKKTRDGIIHG